MKLKMVKLQVISVSDLVYNSLIQLTRIMLFNPSDRYVDLCVQLLHENQNHRQYTALEKIFNDFMQFLEEEPNEEDRQYMDEHLGKILTDDFQPW